MDTSNKYLQVDFGLFVTPERLNETTYSSQTLHLSEHGIGYTNLAFAANKGQKRPIFSFKPLKPLKGLEIQS